MDLTERRDGGTRHPWEVQRFHAYRRILSDHGALDARRVLDVGAGDGWFSDMLADALPDDATTTCWDVHYDANDLEPNRPGVTRTKERPATDHDLVLLLDVLEHIEDPSEFLSEHLAPITTPGTSALVAVPAYQRLFSAHDVALGHHRRYGRQRLLDEVSEWLDVVEHGSLFTSLLLPRAATVLSERMRGDRAIDHGVGTWSGGAAMTRLANGALSLDTRATRAAGRLGVRLPGLSHWAIGVVR